jgi:uncharacterized membrane protein YgcG
MRRLLILLVLFAHSALADPYTYTGQYLSSGTYFSTPDAACNAIFDWRQAELPQSYTYTKNGLSGSWNNNSISCQGNRFSASTGNLITANVVLGKVYRTMCQAGIEDTLTWPFGVKDPVSGEVLDPIQPPWPVCASGCMLNKRPGAPHTESCYSLPDQAQSKVYCDWYGVRTSEGCGNDDEPTPPELPDCPSGYVMGATGCEPETPPDPCEANPTGTGCPGDPCVANPNGEGCPGGGDPGGGDPGGGDPGGGDPGGGDPGGGDPGGGDPGGVDPGGGDPGGGDPGDGEPGNATGFACGEPLTCSGDAIACAQLQFEKGQYCADVEARNFPSQQDEIADFLDNPDYKAEEDEEIDLGQMFSEGTRFLPSSCPQAKTFSLTTMGGRTFSLSFEPLCQFASDLSYLIVAAAAVFYALYVGRAVGGE